MTQKSKNIVYWILTGIFCAMMLFSAYMELFPPKEAVEVMKHLGYPFSLLFLLGIAKLFGSIAILQNKFKTVKEWAYAGFTIDLIGASYAHFSVNDTVPMIITPLVFLAVLSGSYYLWKTSK